MPAWPIDKGLGDRREALRLLSNQKEIYSGSAIPAKFFEGARKSPGVARTKFMMSASRLMHVEDFLRTSASLIEIDTRSILHNTNKIITCLQI